MNTIFLVLGDPLDAVRCLKEVSGGDRVVSWLFSVLQCPTLFMCLDSHGWNDSANSPVLRELLRAAGFDSSLPVSPPLASTEKSKPTIYSKPGYCGSVQDLT